MSENRGKIFPSLPDDASVRDALAINREAGLLLAAFHQQILRGPSNLDIAERELVAAYVSGLNGCDFCCGTHTSAAQCFGIARGTVRALVDDVTLADAPARLRPLLAYARKLTLDHRNFGPSDAQSVFDVGWLERDLHDLILIACTFNFMNRFVHGHGISGDDALWEERGRYLWEHGYAGVAAGADEVRESVLANA